MHEVIRNAPGHGPCKLELLQGHIAQSTLRSALCHADLPQPVSNNIATHPPTHSDKLKIRGNSWLSCWNFASLLHSSLATVSSFCKLYQWKTVVWWIFVSGWLEFRVLGLGLWALKQYTIQCAARKATNKYIKLLQILCYMGLWSHAIIVVWLFMWARFPSPTQR